jgi:hypothetical protein
MTACFRAFFVLVLLVGLPVLAEEGTPGWTVLAAAGVQEGMLEEGEPLAGIRLGLRRAELDGWGGALHVAPGLEELSAFVWAGHRWGTRLGGVTLSAGLDVGGGVVMVDAHGWRYGGMAAGGAVWAGLALPLSGSVTLNVEAQAPLIGALSGGDPRVVPGAWVGLAW